MFQLDTFFACGGCLKIRLTLVLWMGASSEAEAEGTWSSIIELQVHQVVAPEEPVSLRTNTKRTQHYDYFFGDELSHLLVCGGEGGGGDVGRRRTEKDEEEEKEQEKKGNS